MPKVQCQYCGSYIDDTLEKCNVCGATNKYHRRLADDTPRTIEELQQWYVARNLPPEEVTRFFIGKDIREPKAFGIYKQNGKVTVYKNKANGERAVRYSGTDEAYAVNEIYLKLKEEILRQKSNNLNRQRKQNAQSANHRSTKHSAYRRKKKRTPWIIALIFYGIIALMVLFAVGFESWKTKADYYYLDDNKQIYYCNGGTIDMEWWKYDKSTKEWAVHGEFPKNEKPEGVLWYSAKKDASAIAKKLNLNERDIDIAHSRAFIDAGNHKRPKTAYYYHDDKLYYYLDDAHSSYGSKDNTGWYIYQYDDWEFYCSTMDKDALGEDLWYADRDYEIGTSIDDVYDYTDSLSTSWQPSSFQDTEWYESYEENNNAYEQYQQEQRQDDDSDYDWDSNDDWNSDDYDWDSDW